MSLRMGFMLSGKKTIAMAFHFTEDLFLHEWIQLWIQIIESVLQKEELHESELQGT